MNYYAAHWIEILIAKKKALVRFIPSCRKNKDSSPLSALVIDVRLISMDISLACEYKIQVNAWFKASISFTDCAFEL